MKPTTSAALLPLFLAGALLTFTVGCTEYEPVEPTPTPTIARATPRPVGKIRAANPSKVVEGSALNRIFPPSGDGYQVTYTQEKKGFAQAEVTQGGKKIATLSVSDTLANPDAKTKFDGATETIRGFPSARVGDKGTAILVGNRFQVQVRSLSTSLIDPGRREWIAKFNVDALKRLAGE